MELFRFLRSTLFQCRILWPWGPCKIFLAAHTFGCVRIEQISTVGIRTRNIFHSLASSAPPPPQLRVLLGPKHGTAFYRASACNACRSRYCFTNSVRPSVRPSNTGIVSKRVEISSHVFDDLVGTSLQFFSTQPPLQNGNGNPLSGGVKYKGWEFFSNIALYLGNGVS